MLCFVIFISYVIWYRIMFNDVHLMSEGSGHASCKSYMIWKNSKWILKSHSFALVVLCANCRDTVRPCTTSDELIQKTDNTTAVIQKWIDIWIKKLLLLTKTGKLMVQHLHPRVRDSSFTPVQAIVLCGGRCSSCREIGVVEKQEIRYQPELTTLHWTKALPKHAGKELQEEYLSIEKRSLWT